MAAPRKQEFRPTDPKEEDNKFTSASTWNKTHLDLLEVKFDPDAVDRLDLNQVLKVDESEWSALLQARSFSSSCRTNL
jgi:hypothetical protein